MFPKKLSRRAGVAFFSAISAVPIIANAATSTATLRIVEYNVDQDTTGSYSFSTYISDVLGAIGGYSTNRTVTGSSTVSSAAHQIDVIALTEMSSTTVTASTELVSGDVGASVTADAVAAALNKLNNTTTYRASPKVYGYSASDLAYTGNGPSGLVYNSATVSLNATTAVAGSSSTNESRIPVRYTLQAVGSSSASAFNLYVEHAKADQGVADASKRTNEALLVRQDADTVGNPNVIYTGDFNYAGSTNSSTTSGSAEYAYKNLTAAAGSSLSSATYNDTTKPYTITYTAAGTAGTAGKANDPMASTFQGDDKTGTSNAVYSESATSLTAPFDAQLVSDAILYDTSGLQLVAHSELVFGNSYYLNGMLTTKNVEGATISDTTTLDQSILTDLENTTDHLPVIADYTVVVPEPASVGLLAAAIGGTMLRRRRKVCLRCKAQVRFL